MAYTSQRCLAVLGLGAGATIEDARAAYRDLIKVWHPDRFGCDARLRAKAEEMTKQITAAYQAFLASSSPGIPSGRPASHGTAERAARSRGTAPAASGTHTRAVRLSLPGVAVRFGDHPGELVNVSLTGALLRLRFAPPANSTAPLVLEVDGLVLELDTRVVRVGPGTRRWSPRGDGSDWDVSVRFENVPPDVERAIPRFYNLLIAKGNTHARRRAPV